MQLHALHVGQGPLVIDVPHAGIALPAALRARLTPAALALADTDWHVEKLFAFARAEGATLLCATHSRYVVDLNRDPSGVVLYAGADNTEMCPSRSFAGEPIYAVGDAPDDAEVNERRSTYFVPYHATLADQVERVRARHGHAVLLDGHSILSRVPRFFPGKLPDLNLGTADGKSCAPQLQALAAEVLAGAAGFSHVVNGRFKGGWITRHYGQPERGVHALQLEIAQCCYMDEAPPYPWDATRASSLESVLRRLVEVLAAWRPAPG